MTLFISLKYRLKQTKVSAFLILFLFLFFISLGILIYGLFYFMTDGEVNHGDHIDIRYAFVWSETSQILISIGAILSFIFLVLHIASWLIIYHHQIWWVNYLVNRFWYKNINQNKSKENLILDKSKTFKNKHFDFIYLKVDKVTFKETINRDFFAIDKFNTKSETYKIALTAILLGLSIVLSIIEIPGIILPWGSALMIRLFETMVLLIAIKMIGNFYTLIIAIASPWLHFATHALHSPIDVVFYMINNILVVFLFYFIYYVIFKAQAKFAVDNSESQNLHLINDRKTKIRKLFALLSFAVIAALLEALGFYGSYFIITGDFTSLAHKLYYDNVSGRDLVNSLNALYFILTVTAIFVVKYAIEAALFVLIEKKIMFINKQFGLV
ncbi:MPN160 family protein [Mycoplasmopsis agassizii]|uniref:Uncharacterized protein n=1 Tax=Mycoplasmopsis agassizii TaxID=33922 RepID=A0ABX4H4S6_9BACT|nr:ECF transporter S component [Mycoplasmopsis agassizii]PAF54891.1 hypothetical protein CJF60_04100 [Mycoplasmopsis agassizii]SMC17275.1 hypothetical protein SAMN02745179_00433 [Mycoplasmopsis agassizii]